MGEARDLWGSEKIHVLREDGSPTSILKDRKDVHRDGDWHLAVHCWIFSPTRNEILIQRRAANKDSYPNKWDVSVGGHVTAFDSSADTAVKEVEEELGLTFRKEEFEFLYRCRGVFVTKNGKFVNNEFLDVYLVTSDVDLKDVTLQATEVADVRYITIPEIEEKTRANDPDFVPCQFEDVMRPFLDIIKARAQLATT